MKKEWVGIMSQITEDINLTNKIKCPNCGECGIEYTYVGDCNTRIGFLVIWCDKCLKGIHISRVVAPPTAKFVKFDSDLKSIIPKIEFVEM